MPIINGRKSPKLDDEARRAAWIQWDHDNDIDDYWGDPTTTSGGCSDLDTSADGRCSVCSSSDDGVKTSNGKYLQHSFYF